MSVVLNVLKYVTLVLFESISCIGIVREYKLYIIAQYSSDEHILDAFQ